MDKYLPQLSEPAARWARFGVLLALLGLLLWLIYLLRAVFTPIFIALAIAYMLNPIVGWFERCGVRRLLTVVAVYVLSATFVITALVVLGSQTLIQLGELQARLPAYIEGLSHWAEQLQEQLDLGRWLEALGLTEERAGSPGHEAGKKQAPADTPQPSPGPGLAPDTRPDSGGDAPDPATSPVSDGLLRPAAVETPAALAPQTATQPATPRLWAVLRPWVLQSAADWAQDGWSRAASFVGGVVNLLMLAVLIPMYTFFFLWRFDAIIRTIHAHLPAGPRPTIVRIVSTIDQATANFFRGRLTTCLLVGTLNGIGWLVVGVQFSLVLGLLAGVLNLVPFMGVLALPPALLFAYLGAVEQGLPWFWPMLLAFVVYMIVQTLESFIFSPLFEGSSVGLHPITTVVALLIGAQLAGTLGMVLAIPLASTIKTLSAEWLLPEVRRLAAAPGGSDPPPESSG